MTLEAGEGLTLTTCTAEPGTPTHDGLAGMMYSGVERVVERGAANYQCNQRSKRYPPCCLCR